MKIMQLIAQTQGDRPQVYAFFLANTGQLDEKLSQILPDLFATLIQQNEPSMIAGVFVEFGDLISQFPLGNRAKNIEMAISSYKQAVKVYTRNTFPEQWAGTKNNLANAYKNRIQGKRAKNLEMAISSYKQALQVYTRNTFPEQWAMTQNNLAIAYNNRIQGKRAKNLEMAISSYKQALQVYTHNTFPKQWAATQNNLANAYKNRIQGERAENLEMAISTYTKALQVYTRDAFPEQWAMTQNNLANAYSESIRGKRTKNIEMAISSYKQALQIYTRNTFPEQWAMTQNNLAIAYNNRIQGERAENLELAISTHTEALQVYARNTFPEQWAATQNNLANAYSERIREERVENLELTISAYKQALQVYTRNTFPEQWAMTQNNLAIAYNNRIQGEKVENLELAISAYTQALKVYTRNAFPEQWATTQNNLANAYKNRIQGKRAKNLELAISAYTQALKVRTYDAFPEQWAMTQNNLAIAYNKRIEGKRAKNLELAVSAYTQALKVYTHDVFSKECRQTAQNLGNLHFQEKSWTAARDAYQIATAAAETLYQASISCSGKSDELKATADIPRRLAYTQAQLGDYQAAVLTLEQGRARGLSESLNRDRATLSKLQTLAPNLYAEYQNITQQLRNLESRDRDRMVSTDQDRVPDDLIDTTMKLRKTLENTIAQIRQFPNYNNFLTPTQWKNITIALRPDNPLVYLVTTPNGGMALTVTINMIEVLWLNDLTETQLFTLLSQTWFAAYEQSQTDHQSWHDAINTTTRQLWDSLMGPLVQQITKLGFKCATLIPTGYLSLLPLHTAWTEDSTHPTGRRYALDNIHITYAPNAKSLTAAQIIADRVQAADSILAIDNPRQDLPNSEREINCAISTFSQSNVLRHEKATIAAVKDGLVGSSIIHFSCHGTANMQAPLNSGLLMYDELLTLKEIFALNLTDSGGIRLAILSACETGLVGIENTDEVISLPTGLIQAGVAAVIASLWSVSDLSTMMLLARFYELWRIDGLEISLALRQAQQWVRDTTNGEKLIYFKGFIPIQSSNKMPANAADYLYKSLILSHPDARDFAHPFHWAAFNYVGV